MSDGLSHVSVTPTMSRSFDKTKSLNADVLLRNAGSGISHRGVSLSPVAPDPWAGGVRLFLLAEICIQWIHLGF